MIGAKESKDQHGKQVPPKSLKLVLNDLESYDYFVDGVFSPESTQSDVFEEIKPFIQSSIDGDNVCIFAYG